MPLNPTPGTFSNISINPTPMPSTGYVVVFVDNNSIGTDVWFDNVQVSHYSGQVLEENHYYPFGLTISESTNNSSLPVQPYKLTTKELEKAFDLNMYDFGARQFDMQLGRWTSVDPLAEMFSNASPFNYCNNNPIRNIDMDGRKWRNAHDQELAQSLTLELNTQISETNGSIEKLNKKKAALEEGIANGDKKAEKYKKQLTGVNASIQQQNERLGDLTSSKKEIAEMGASEDFTFTYKDVTGSVAYTKRNGYDVTIEYTGNLESAIHESAHGYQKFIGIIYTRENKFQLELEAYQRQFSFNPGSFPTEVPSDWGIANKRADITVEFIKFINYGSGSYPYMIGVSYEAIQEHLKSLKGK